ncbi:MAG: Rieske 2Fe-2S domain-containing protein [Acidimicrobiales bacterium]
MTTTDPHSSPRTPYRPESEARRAGRADAADSLLPGTEEYIEDPRHYGIEHGAAWPDDVPHGQNDTHWRYEGDPRGARIAELRIAFCWFITLLSGIGLAAVFVAGGEAQVEGAFLFAGFAGLGVGFVLWARDLLPGHDVIASRGGLTHASDDADRRLVVQSLGRGLEPMARRPFLGKVLGGVLTVFGLGLLFPIASLGPRVHGQFVRTPWRRNRRAVSEDGTPIKPSDILPNGVLTAFPDTGEDLGGQAMAQSAVLLINVGSAPFEVLAGRESWHIGNVGSVNCIVGFSKICTHAGCPVSLYNWWAHELVCPCHQSTFQVLEDCKPVFGPAPRNLPQLPLAVDAEGYIVSQSDFTEPVGPGYWNRPIEINPFTHKAVKYS